MLAVTYFSDQLSVKKIDFWASRLSQSDLRSNFMSYYIPFSGPIRVFRASYHQTNTIRFDVEFLSNACLTFISAQR